MTPEMPDAADRQRAIDTAQRKFDEHDGKADGKIDHPKADDVSDADREKLTALYIGRVNDLQGRIADTRRTVEIAKNTREPWQALERACGHAENGLLECMAKVDPKTMHEMVDAFDTELAVLLEKFLASSSEKNGTQETEAPFKAAVLMEALGLPKEGGDALIKAAVEHYGEDGIRAVYANMELASRVPESIHQELFGCPPVKVGKGVESAKIAILLGNGSLENSSYNYLLQDPAGKVRGVREAARDRSGRVQSRMDTIKAQELVHIQLLVEETKNAKYEWKDTLVNVLRAEAYITAPFLSAQIDAILPSKIDAEEKGVRLHVKAVMQLRASSGAINAEKRIVDGIVTALDTALAVHGAEEARLSGRTEEADRRLMQLLEKHGEDLKNIDPSLAKRATNSAVRLRDQKKLTPAEESLLFSDPRSPEALKKAIEQKGSESSAVDVLDQVRAKQTFRAGSFEKYAPPKGSVFYNGRDVTGALGIGSRTTLSYSSGKTLNVIVTPQAQRVLETLPPEREPVLLRPISSMNSVQEGSGRGGVHSILKNAPSDCIVQHTDIGFIDESGNVVRDDQKTTFDLSQNKNRSMIESQIRNQKGFRLEAYQPKFPLRTLENKPYPYGLQTLKTQSGITVEGITIAQDAIGIINTDPPEGQTLVLKRIPRAISLRTPDSERIGRDSRSHQKVLNADMVSRQDLAYARIDGDHLVTRDVGTQTESTASIAQTEKEQEEKTRDLQRVLDRNPAIRNVKNTASTIQQTAGHLQKFLEAGKSGSAREAFVQFARSEAKPTLEMLTNPQLKQDIDQARSALLQLKGVNGIALGGLEKKIDEQLKALEGFSAMLTNGRTENLLRTITDESKFSADNWKNFFANELPVIVASIVLACAAAALVVATCGAGFVAIASATALGGVIGAELGKEAVYYGHQYLDSDVRSGSTAFTGRSNLGSWAAGQQDFDEKTGQFRQRAFWGDVACPFAKDFAIGFATTLATMGIGNIAGAQLSKLLQNGNVVKKLAGRSDIMKAVARKLASLSKNQEALEKAANLKEAITRALRSLPKEIGEEFGDEAQENILEKFLNQLDLGLAVGSSLDGKITAGNVAAVLLATFKGTRIGKGTIAYEVSGKNPESIAARAQAIRSEAEANGAIVTDLGKGVLSIQHPVEGPNGTVQYETVQMEPTTVETDRSTDTAPLDADIPKLSELRELLEGKGKTLEEVHAALGIDLTAPEHQEKIGEIMRVHEMEPTGINAKTGEKEYSASDIQDKALALKAAGFKVNQIDYLIREGICGLNTFFRSPPFCKSPDHEQRPDQSNDLLKTGTIVRNRSGTWQVLGIEHLGSDLYTLTPFDAETVQKFGSDFSMVSPRSALDIVQTGVAPDPKRKSLEPRPTPERDRGVPKNPLEHPPIPNIHLEIGDRVKVKLPEGGEIDCHIVAFENGQALVINGESIGYRHRRVPVEQLRSWNQPENFVRKPFTVGEEVYTRRSNGVYEKGWKIAENPPGTYVLHNQNQKIERDFDPREAFHIDELEHGRLPGDLHIEASARMIVKQNDVLERHAALSEKQFHKLFDGDFSQQNVGNCFLIAAFNSVRSSPQFETIMRTCVKQTEAGYVVYLPLGTSFDQQRTIPVSAADLKAQTVVRNGKRIQLLPVQSSVGWQVLEAAYSIGRFGSVDRAKMNEGGFGNEALVQLFGEGVETQVINATQGGQKNLEKPFASADPSGRKTVEKWLENFNNGKDIATVNTPRTPTGMDTETFRVGRNSFYKNHAYSVQSVDKIRQTVTVVNPHDTSAPINLSYDEFFRAFSDVRSVNLEYAKMFRGLTGRQGRREGGKSIPSDNVRPRRQTVVPFRGVASSAEVAQGLQPKESSEKPTKEEPAPVRTPPVEIHSTVLAKNAAEASDLTTAFAHFTADPKKTNLVRSFTETATDKKTGVSQEVPLEITFSSIPSFNDRVDVIVTSSADRTLRIPMRISDGGKYVSVDTTSTGKFQGQGLYSKIMRPLLKDAETVSGYIAEEHTLRANSDSSHADLAARSPTAAARGDGFITEIVADRELVSYRVDQKLSSILRIATDFEKYKNADPATAQQLHSQYGGGFSKESLLASLRRYEAEQTDLRPEVREVLKKQIASIEKDTFHGIPATLRKREWQEAEAVPHISGKRTLTPEQRRARDTFLALPDSPAGLQARLEAAHAVLPDTPWTALKEEAVLLAHQEVAMSGTRSDGGNKYSESDLYMKMRVLEEGGFTRDEGDTLIRMGVCGNLPSPPPPPNRPNVQPPPPPASPTPGNVLKPNPAIKSPPPPPGYVPRPIPPPPPPRSSEAPKVQPPKVNIMPPPPRPSATPARAPVAPNTPKQQPIAPPKKPTEAVPPTSPKKASEVSEGQNKKIEIRSVEELDRSLKKQKGPVPARKFPQPNPEAIKYETGTKVWLTSYITGESHVGLCYLVKTGNTLQLSVPGNSSTENGRLIPLTPIVRSKLAPVRDLQSEAVNSLNKNGGWKLHLNFDPGNPKIIGKVNKVLKELETRGMIPSFKIGHGGGAAFDQPGKEATVYVGDGEKTKSVVSYLEHALSDVLLPPTKQVLQDDAVLGSKIVGRFDVNGDSYFHQYGSKGISFTNRDALRVNIQKTMEPEEAREKADRILRERYGSFYSGGLPD